MKKSVYNYSKLLFGVLIVQILLLWANIQEAYSTGTKYTFLEKVRKSKGIIFAKFIDESEEDFEIHYMPGNSYVNIKVPIYANYEVLSVMKGDFNKNTLKVDFQKINARYKPVRGAGIVTPNDSGIVLFMFEEDGYTFKGSQGKINVEPSKLASYKEAVRISLEFDKIDESLKLDKIIEYFDTKPVLIESMFRELYVYDNNLHGVKISALLYNEDWKVRQRALMLLKGTRLKTLVPLIIELSQDPSFYVRRAAATVLGGMNDNRAEKTLRNLTNDEHSDVRASSFISLPKTNANIVFFIRGLDDSLKIVNQAAVNSLQKLKSEESTDAMISILNSTDSNRKKLALDVLSHYDSPKAVSAISILLTNSDINTQYNALRAMVMLSRHHPASVNDPKIIDNIMKIVVDDNSIKHKMEGIELLGRLNAKKALPLLKDNLNHSDPKIRIISARAIVMMKEVSLIAHMESLLENEKDRYVAKHLQRAIKSLQNPRSSRRR